MKINNNSKILILIVFINLIFINSCEDTVSPEVFSELTPETVLNDENGIEVALNSAYAEFQFNAWIGKSALNLEEWTTDIEWETGGGENLTATQMINFTWDASTAWINNQLWDKAYRAIRNANIVLDNIEQVDISENKKRLISAEARFIRAGSYYRLLLWFGGVPLRKSTTDELELPRSSTDEIESFIETELLASVPDLPEFGDEARYGRAHKSGARAFLAKFYLNTKQWQKAADISGEIINNGLFELYPSFPDLFKVENERNSEYIWVHPAIPSGPGNLYINGAYPPGFSEDPNTAAFFTDRMNNWAAQYRLWDDFYFSFEESDERQIPILFEYINNQGEHVSLLEENDNTRSLKFFPDPNASGNNHGNDIPDIRYADILLTRAEALNELNGPNQESISLINQVRNRAGLEDLSLSEFSSADELRSHILKERGLEFYSERKRRQDLIRHDRFIESAQERGKNQAQPFHRLFPIPQAAMDSNPELEQNPGY